MNRESQGKRGRQDLPCDSVLSEGADSRNSVECGMGSGEWTGGWLHKTLFVGRTLSTWGANANTALDGDGSDG